MTAPLVRMALVLLGVGARLGYIHQRAARLGLCVRMRCSDGPSPTVSAVTRVRADGPQAARPDDSGSARSLVAEDASVAREYLVEFRSTNDLFRLNEFTDAARCCGVAHPLHFRSVILDMFQSEPIAAYVGLRDDEEARQVAQRCSTVRSVIEVWGETDNAEDLVRATSASYASTHHAYFDALESRGLRNTWSVDFRHYGKGRNSGMQKSAFLMQFNDMFIRVNGTVDLTHPTTRLVYLEDCFDFQSAQNACHISTLKAASAEDKERAAALLEAYKPRRLVFGRQVAAFPSIAHSFDLRTRPFIGTTAMEPVSAHITANAALVVPGSRVLDPFCGTGSLLLPCALLGAYVRGSDIDADCLGLLDRAVSPMNNRSKNSNFVREEGYQEGQSNGCTATNFEHYGLSDRLLGLHAMDAERWCDDDYAAYEFDAMVSDPPFGYREKSRGGAAGQPLEVLLRIASARLRAGGRLAFWMPSEALTEERTLRASLEGIAATAGVSNASLSFVRATRQDMSSRLWRWLVVYEKK